ARRGGHAGGGADEFLATTRRGTDAYFGNPLRQGRERPLARFLAAYSRYACDDGAFPASPRPRFIFPASRLPRGAFRPPAAGPVRSAPGPYPPGAGRRSTPPSSHAGGAGPAVAPRARRWPPAPR